MITILCTTNRPQSRSAAVASYYRRVLKAKGADSILFSMEELPADFIFTDMYDNRTEAFRKILAEKIIPVSKLVVIAPEYNGSSPGVFKTFIDACESEIFTGKKTALVGIASGRAGNLRGLDHLTSIFHHLKMEVLSTRVTISGIKNELDTAGELTNPATVKLIERQVELFLKF